MFKSAHQTRTSTPYLARMLASSIFALGLVACGQAGDFVDGEGSSSLAEGTSVAAAFDENASAEDKGVKSRRADAVVPTGQTDAVPAGQTDVASLDPPQNPAPPASNGPAAAPSIYSVQTLVDDMNLPNENNWWLAVNRDLTANYNGPDKGYGNTWAYVGNGIRAADGYSYWPKKYLDTSFGFTGSTPIRRLGWYVIARANQVSPTALNTRAQTRNFKNWILYRNGTWALGGENAIGIPYPGNWHANFSSPGNEMTQSVVTGGGLGQARQESSGASIGSIGSGDRSIWAIHAWPADITLPHQTWVRDVVGVVTVFEARLIVHDANQPDDRKDAGLMVWTGADWYQGSRYIGEHSHGRLKLIKNEWNIFSTTDIPEAVLKANPPPGYTR